MLRPLQVCHAPSTLGRCHALQARLLIAWARSNSLPVIAHWGHLQFRPEKTGNGEEERGQEAKGERSVPALVHPKAGPGMPPFSGLTPPSTGFLLLPFSRTPPTHPFASAVSQSSAFQGAPNHSLRGPTLICMDTPKLGSDTLININPLITQELAAPCTKIGPLFKVYGWSFDYFS